MDRVYYNNPINLLVDDQIQDYSSLKEFYLKLLKLLLQDSPRGHIDYMVFLHDHTPLRGTPLGECCRGIERGWEESEGHCIHVHWTYRVQTRDKLTDFVRKLTRHATNSDFDFRQFDAAWNTFLQSFNNE